MLISSRNCILFASIFLTPIFVCTSHADSEEDLCQVYLDVVEESVTYFEPLWVDVSDRIPNSGFFDFRKYKNWRDEPYATIITISGNGMVSYCYSVLLTETDKETFTSERVPREILLDHAVKSIRWCCLTSSYVENPYPYLPDTRSDFADGPYWRRQWSWRADEVGWLTLACAKLWPYFDDETKNAVEAVMIGGAPTKRLVQTWYPNGQGGNHDQVKQDLSSTMGAAFLFPEREDSDMYLDIIRGNAIDMVSTLQDSTKKVVASGKSVSEWHEGWNLYQDYSSDHHGWCNLWYGCDLLFEGRGYVEVLSALTDIPVTQTFTYKGNGFDGVLEWVKLLCLPEGEPGSVHGNEYDAYYGAGLLAYCYGAILNKDPVASAFEHRAASLLKRHSRAIKQYDYHRNSWAKAATAYLMHKYQGPAAEPLSFQEACRRLDGTYHHRWHQNLIHRCRDKWASFSWGSISSKRVTSPTTGSGLCGIVIPARPDEEEPVPFVYCHPKSLIGVVEIKNADGEWKRYPPESTYRVTRDDTGFHTAGVISGSPLERFYSFHSFENGPCVLVSVFRAKETCQFNWSGLPVYFYVREGLTDERELEWNGGKEKLGEELTAKSNWWCVDDTIGMAVLGGMGNLNVERSTGYNWARNEEYKDKCDGVFVSRLDDIHVGAGDTGLYLAAVIYTETPSEKVAEAAGRLPKNGLWLPEGWRGLVIPDVQQNGKRFISIANLYGTQTEVVLQLSFDEGAPILSTETQITGNSSFTPIHVPAPGALGEICELYLTVSDNKSVIAQKVRENRYSVQPIGDEQVSIRVCYAGLGGEEILVTDANGQEIDKVKVDSADQNLLTLDLTSLVWIDIQGDRYIDRTAPAVEIAEIEVREDGRVAVEVCADDRSGIERVDLFCDEELVDRKLSSPFVSLCRPGKGNHTFYAVAVDASRRKNERTSYKRTVSVPF